MDFLTVQEAAQALRISSRTFRALIEAGQIPHIKCGVRLIRVERQALTEWVANGGAPSLRDSSPATAP